MFRCAPLRVKLFLFLLVIMGAGASPAPVAAHPLVLDLSIDGVVQGEAIVADQRADGLWLRVEDVPALRGLAQGAAEIRLDRVSGLAYRLDAATQSLALTLPPPAARPRAPPSALPSAPPVTPNGWGGYLNYDAVASRVEGRGALDAALDLRLFSPRALAYSGVVLHAGREYFGQGDIVRLDSGISLPDRTRMRRWTFGDFIGGATAASRPVRLGGVQLTTDFDLRPDLVTFPVPALAGAAALPSAVDVVAEGARRQAEASGQASLATVDPPVTTGLNRVSVVSRDALGRDTVQSLSFYTSRALLRPGLSAVSLDLGFVRTGYATSYDRYRTAAAAATWRRGLSEQVTLELHGEATRGVASAGGGATAGLGTLGTLYAAASASGGRVLGRAGGAQIVAGWERLARPISLTARYVRSTRGYADVAARYGSPVRRDTLVANIGFDLRRYGTFSAALLRLGRGWQTPLDAWGRRIRDAGGATRRLEPLTLASATAAVPLGGRVSLVANATRTLGDARGTSVSVGLLTLLGPRASAQASAERRNGGMATRVGLAMPAVVPGDIGYRADLATGALDRQAAQVEAIGTRGRYQATVDRIGDTTTARVATQGALVLLPSGLFRADRIDGSFALIDTQGEARVPVFRENRPAGMTDRRGFLIVTGLLPYQPNRISLDPQALDIDLALASGEQVVRPREFAGARVDFGLRRTEGRTLHLIDAAGRDIPAGGRAALNGTAAVPVGQGGEVYLTDLAPSNALRVTYGVDGRCEVTFADTVAQAEVAPTIRCLPAGR